jgi:hypothetical protein
VRSCYILATDWVVVDAVFMVDAGLMRQLLRAIPDRAAVLLMGDVDQLPCPSHQLGPNTRDAGRGQQGLLGHCR